jgi:hypothetical protein
VPTTRIRSLGRIPSDVRDRASLRAIVLRLRALPADQRGEMPIAQVLVIGLIVIPLVMVLLVFRAEIITWFALNVVDFYTAPEMQPF